jgi:Ca2+-transporting ATPase
VIVGSLNDWHKERQFCILNEKKEERRVKVIRSGIERVIDVKELLVGDIALLEPGEIVPCDGVFISGHNIKCDESGTTGEPSVIRKVGYDECISLREQAKREHAGVHEFNVSNCHTDCFMVSGSKVLEGYGKYVCHRCRPEEFQRPYHDGYVYMEILMTDLRTLITPLGLQLVKETQILCPLQEKLNDLAELIAKIGSAAGVTLSIALMVHFFVRLGTGGAGR